MLCSVRSQACAVGCFAIFQDISLLNYHSWICRYMPHLKQCAKKVVSDSSGLVDFAIRLVIFVLNLPDRQVLFYGNFKLQKDCNKSC